MSDVVLDASSILAVLNEESGAERVEAAIRAGAAVSTVNLSEVIAKLADSGLDEEAVREALGNVQMAVVSFDDDLAYRAGLLRPLTRGVGLSFGDRACLALAQRLGLPAMTADRAWSDLAVGVTIEVIR